MSPSFSPSPTRLPLQHHPPNRRLSRPLEECLKLGIRENPGALAATLVGGDQI